MVLVLLQGLWMTVMFTVISFIIGAILALPIAWARVSKVIVLRIVATAVIEVVRAVPVIVWLLVVYLALVVGTWRPDPVTTAIIAFSVITAAYLAEIYRAAMMGIPAGQWEASHALGIPRLQGFLRVIIPQAVPLVIPAAATFAIGLLKDSAIASIIGTKDITYYAHQWSQLHGGTVAVYSLTAVIYVVLSIPIAIAARRSGDVLRKRVMG